MPKRASKAVVTAMLAAAAVAAAPVWGQSTLPEGPGRDLVDAACTGCHPVNRILRSSGYDRAGWEELVGTMIDLSDAVEDRDAITGYLAAQFPPNDRRAPKLISGKIEIAFREWVVPTLGQRSRDPAEAADSTIWWAGQWGNLIGRIDPATGAMTEYPLPAGAMPHSVTIDSAGGVWYTGNKNATMGRLDPASGDVKEWPSPSGATSHPYAIAIVDGAIWYSESGQRPDALVRFDPATESFQSWAIPSGGVYAGIVRHMRPTKSGDLLIHQSATNRIILVSIEKDPQVRQHAGRAISDPTPNDAFRPRLI